MRGVFFRILILALALGACGDRVVIRPPMSGIPPAQQPPAGGAVTYQPPVPLVKPPGEGTTDPRSVVILPGDTVHSIAQRYQVPNRALIEANRLEPPYALEPGRVLILPAPQFHTVARGDTLYSLSRRYRTDLSALARLNDLGPPYGIYEGQILRLPGQAIALAPASAAPPTPAPVAPPPSSPAGGGITVQEIPAPPPSPALPPAAAAAPDPPPTPVPAAPPPPPVQADPPQTVSLPPGRAGTGQFLWPAQGRLLSGFGTKPGGQHNDGINIEVAQGTPVRAAEGGTVIYAGNELKGYGNLLLIRHAGGWVTAYAHNEELLVRRGARVSRGQVIARAGSTGGVPSPQVHFEIRRGREAVDPMRYLGPPDAVSGAAGRAVRTGPG